MLHLFFYFYKPCIAEIIKKEYIVVGDENV